MCDIVDLYIIDGSVILRCVKIRFTCSPWNLVIFVSSFVCKVIEVKTPRLYFTAVTVVAKACY